MPLARWTIADAVTTLDRPITFLRPSIGLTTIDVADVARTIRRGWRALAICTVLGVLAALAVLVFAPPKYSASSSLVMRMGSDPSSSLISRLSGGLGDAAAGVLSSTKSPTETEIQILSSRAVIGPVVDSLRLQARITKPRGIPPARFIESLSAGGSF